MASKRRQICDFVRFCHWFVVCLNDIKCSASASACVSGTKIESLNDHNKELQNKQNTKEQTWIKAEWMIRYDVQWWPILYTRCSWCLVYSMGFLFQIKITAKYTKFDLAINTIKVTKEKYKTKKKSIWNKYQINYRQIVLNEFVKRSKITEKDWNKPRVSCFQYFVKI